jgi:predicted component of type VI protein secretion system
MTVLIKDLSLDKELDRKEMSAVRGGLANQANGTNQVNNQSLFAPVSVGNGSTFGGGPVNIQVDSYATQTASNDSTSSNSQGGFPMMYWPA